MQIRKLCSLLCVLVCSIAARAHADAPDPEQARGLAAQQAGDRLRAAGDLPRALEYYRAAYAILHEPQSGLALANTQADLGMLVEARQIAAEASTLPTKPDESRDDAAARKAAGKLATTIEARLPVFGVAVSPDVPYTLRIDGVAVPEHAQSLRFRTNPGPHTVQIEADGYEPATSKFDLAEGVHQLFEIALQPLRGATVVATPLVTTSPPPASQPQPAPPPPTAAAKPEPPPEDSAAHAKRMRGYIALTIGGVALAAGAITGVMSFTETSNAKRNCPDNLCPNRLRDELETADTLANISNVALPIGLLGIAYGLFELLTLPEHEPVAHAGVSFQVDARGAYASWRGRL